MSYAEDLKINSKWVNYIEKTQLHKYNIAEGAVRSRQNGF